MKKILFLFAIVISLFIGITYLNNPKNDDIKSVIYKKNYAIFKKELKYARVTIRNRWIDSKTGELNENGSKKVKLIKDKNTLVEIVKGFDKLFKEEPTFYKGEIIKDYVLVIWRQGMSVSYVYYKTQDGYFFGIPPWYKDGTKDIEIPDSLVKLIEET